MRAHGKTVLNMDKELINLVQEIAIRESIKMENHMGKVSTFGEMVKYILVNFDGVLLIFFFRVFPDQKKLFK